MPSKKRDTIASVEMWSWKQKVDVRKSNFVENELPDDQFANSDVPIRTEDYMQSAVGFRGVCILQIVQGVLLVGIVFWGSIDVVGKFIITFPVRSGLWIRRRFELQSLTRLRSLVFAKFRREF